MKSIAIVGTNPDKSSNNIQLQENITNGFRELNPDLQVFSVSPDEYLNEKFSLEVSFCLFHGSVANFRYPVEALLEKGRRLADRTAIWLHEDPYEFDASWRISGLTDVVFTADRASTYHYPSDWPVFHLPMASSSVHLHPVVARSGPDYLFVGRPFKNRIAFFKRMENSCGQHSKHLQGMIIGPDWPDNLVTTATNTRISQALLARLYGISNTVIYLGKEDNQINGRFNIRASTPGSGFFAAAGAGACQIAFTPGLEITDYLDPGKEFVLIENATEAVETIAELRNDLPRSLKIGLRAQSRVSKQHLYRHRAKAILDILKQI